MVLFCIIAWFILDKLSNLINFQQDFLFFTILNLSVVTSWWFIIHHPSRITTPSESDLRPFSTTRLAQDRDIRSETRLRDDFRKHFANSQTESCFRFFALYNGQITRARVWGPRLAEVTLWQWLRLVCKSVIISIESHATDRRHTVTTRLLDDSNPNIKVYGDV